MNNRQEMASSRSYRLKKKEEPAEGIVRIALGRAEKALEGLRDADENDNFAGAIHSARRDLKKLRSVARLGRAELGEERFRVENKRYRDAGRRLSASRDAEVRLETLEALEKRFENELPADAVGEWSKLLAHERKDPSSDRALAAQVESAISEIEIGRDEIGRWQLSANSWDLLAPGIKRSYKRGRREMKRARAGRRARDVHDWRKRVKDLWYQLRIVRGAWPALINETADQAHDLADLLGDHHDLAVLHEDLKGREGLSDEQALVTAIERRQEELVEDALRLGARLYAERPGAFIHRLSVYWEAWRD
jgi:CHAD domain-containing protein